MMSALASLRFLVRVAVRNLFAGRLKTAIVGGIVGVGALLVVVGTSVLDSVNQGMARSIIGSAAGNLQIYEAASRDELALYGGMMGDPDLAPIPDFSRLKRTVARVPNVRMVIPEGVSQAMASSGNELDFALEKLRRAASRRLAGETVEEHEYEALKDHVRQMIGLLQRDAQASNALLDSAAVDPQAPRDLERAGSDGFWANFERDPLAALEFLENRIAPQSVDGDFIWVRYIGTDLDAFARGFDRLEIVEGTPVPKGERGLLFGKLYYEESLKLKTALRLDQLREAIRTGGGRIARDAKLQQLVRENQTQVREIVVQLDSLKRREMVGRLQRALGSSEADVSKLLVALLSTDDRNFEERYRIFHEQVAPLVRLYQVRPGDVVTIKAVTRSGYVKSVNLKLYGICQFRGLERSASAGNVGLMDIMSFRDLYGHLTADRAKEIASMKKAAAVKEVTRAEAESVFFGSDHPIVERARAVRIDDALPAGAPAAAAHDRRYTQEEIDAGVALNAAVLLDDPTRAEETAAAIRVALERDGMKMKVVSWKEAAGMLGQLITVLRLVLAAIVAILFAVALVIITNAMVMATLERVKEIGALRAMGAHRPFVLLMVGLETCLAGLFFGAIGAALGALAVVAMGRIGIPAPNPDVQFFFSGPRLHPALSGANLAVALVVVLVVSILSGLYPAIVATRVSPLAAMQSDE